MKAMLDEVCEVAKQEMKEKGEEELGSSKHAATFTIRNYCSPLLPPPVPKRQG